MKKIINYSILIAFIIGTIFCKVYPINLKLYSFFTSFFSFKYILYLILIIILLLLLPILSINFSYILLIYNSFIFGYMLVLFLKNFGIIGIIFILTYMIIIKLLNLFILYLSSFYTFKFIKHIYLNIFSKYKRNKKNLSLYFKKNIIMILIYFINNILLLCTSFLIIPSLLKLFKISL